MLPPENGPCRRGGSGLARVGAGSPGMGVGRWGVLTAARVPAATALPRASPPWGAARSAAAKATRASWKVAKVSQASACLTVPAALTCHNNPASAPRHRHWDRDGDRDTHPGGEAGVVRQHQAGSGGGQHGPSTLGQEPGGPAQGTQFAGAEQGQRECRVGLGCPEGAGQCPSRQPPSQRWCQGPGGCRGTQYHPHEDERRRCLCQHPPPEAPAPQLLGAQGRRVSPQQAPRGPGARAMG